MKIVLNLLFIYVLINCVCLRKLRIRNVLSTAQRTDPNDMTRSESVLKFENLEQNQLLVKQLIDELTNNLHNKTLVNKIRNLNGRNDHQQLISNLTGNLDDKDPLMSQYLDNKLKTYLLKVQQQSLNQTIDLMDVLKQFKDIVSITNFNLTNEFQLINKTDSNESMNKQDEFELIYAKNATDLNSTKLSRMEFLTDTLISLLIGKLIGLKIGFFAGKLIAGSVPFALKKPCVSSCQTNTWPSDMPGLEPTPPSILRNQFISMKADRKPVNGGGSSVDSISSTTTTSKKPDLKTESWKAKEKKNKPTIVQTNVDDDEWSENEEDDWRAIDEDEEEFDEKSTKRPSRPRTRPKQMKHRNKYFYANGDELNSNFDKQVEQSLDDLDEEPNQINFKQYSNYHPVYSSTYQPFGYSNKNSHLSTIHQYTQTPFYSSTTNLPQFQATAVQLYPSTVRNRKNYMLLTG